MTNEQAKAIRLLRDAAQAALSYHGVTLTSLPPKDAWTYHRVGERLNEALRLTESALAPIAAGVVPDTCQAALKAAADAVMRLPLRAAYDSDVCKAMAITANAAILNLPAPAHPVAGASADQFTMRWAVETIYETFKKDLDQGYRTKDKEFAVSIAGKALEHAPASPAVATDELHFNALRLRNVVKLVGLPDPFPDDDEALDGARGSMLGQIAGVLRTRATAAPSIPEAGAEEPNTVLLIDDLLMSWLRYKDDTPENRERRINAREAVEKAFAQRAPADEAQGAVAYLHELVEGTFGDTGFNLQILMSEDEANSELAALGGTIKPLYTRAQPTAEEVTDTADEDAYLIDRLGKLLADIAITLKGEEAPRHRHSYHDLPELVKVMAIELDMYKTIYGTTVPGAWLAAEEVTMLKRQIHNLKRHIEDYCQPAPKAGSSESHIGNDHPPKEWTAAEEKELHAILAEYPPEPDRSLQSWNAGEGVSHHSTCNGRFPTLCKGCMAEDAAEPAPSLSMFATVDDYKQAKAEHAKRAEPSGAELRLRFLAEWYGLSDAPNPWPEHFMHAFTGWMAANRAWQARAALQQQSGVPDGWQVVPPSATAEMLKALWGESESPGSIVLGQLRYRAMLAAAPTLGGNHA